MTNFAGSSPRRDVLSSSLERPCVTSPVVMVMLLISHARSGNCTPSRALDVGRGRRPDRVECQTEGRRDPDRLDRHITPRPSRLSLSTRRRGRRHLRRRFSVRRTPATRRAGNLLPSTRSPSMLPAGRGNHGRQADRTGRRLLRQRRPVSPPRWHPDLVAVGRMCEHRACSA